MKKLVYILSIAIGLVVTGCAQWEDFDSLSPDTWGPVPELTVSIDSTCLDDAGNLKKDYLPLQIETKHATHMAYAVSTDPADIDYTALLQGQYGNYTAEVDSAGYVFARELQGVTPGTTYYIYAVAANAAGVQTTAMRAIGAVDVDAPQPLTDPQLVATQKGMRAVITFNENILRDETMGAISYTIYNIDTNELFAEGVVADATAAGDKLTVTLPATVVYDENTYYIVVLSFEEGAVTDIYGNKMSAIEGVYNVDEMNVENGYWWLVEPAGEVPEGFFREGVYAWSFQLTEDQKEWYALTSASTFAYEGEFDMSQLDPYFDGVMASQWSIDGFMTDVFQFAKTQSMPALTFVENIEGYDVELMMIVDFANMDAASLGELTFQVDQQGNTIDLPIYFGDLDYDETGTQQVIYVTPTFAVMEGECIFDGGYPVLYYEYGGSLYLLVMLDELVLSPADGSKAAQMRVRAHSDLNLELGKAPAFKNGGIKKISTMK